MVQITVQPETWSVHFWQITLPLIIGQVIIQSVGHYKNREIGKRRDAQNEVLDANFPRHRHDERRGPLTADGVHFPERMNSKGH